MRRVLSVIGTRPEAVKLAPVIAALERRPRTFDSRVCVTGQQREMLEPVLACFELSPDWDLELAPTSGPMAAMASGILERLPSVLDELAPDVVLVQGDTTTAFAAALTAFYAGCPLGHVEAGLRTGTKWRPFPEEIHRRLADELADLAFAPTERARRVLEREAWPAQRVWVTGNPVVDAVRGIAQAATPSPSRPELLALQRFLEADPTRQLIVATAHRREHFGPPMDDIAEALGRIVDRQDGTAILLPLHRNPQAGRALETRLAGQERIYLTPSLPYPRFVHWLQQASLVMTDSGGLQEEGPALGVPVLVMREATERPEALEAGAARRVGTDPERIVAEAERLLRDPQERARLAHAPNPFGDGRAAERIADALATAPLEGRPRGEDLV